MTLNQLVKELWDRHARGVAGRDYEIRNVKVDPKSRVITLEATEYLMFGEYQPESLPTPFVEFIKDRYGSHAQALGYTIKPVQAIL